MIVVVIAGTASLLAQLHTGRGAGEIAVVPRHTLPKGIVGVVVIADTGGAGALAQPGQLALGPGQTLALVGSGTANGIVGNCGTAIYILPPSPPTVKKKPPRP